MMWTSIGFSPISSIGLGRMAEMSPNREPSPPQSTKIGTSAGSGVGMGKARAKGRDGGRLGMAGSKRLKVMDLADQPARVAVLQQRAVAIDGLGDRILG